MDVLALDGRAGDRMVTLLSAIPEDRWGAATPCSEWTVRDLVDHIVAGNVKYAGIALGDDFAPGAPDVAVGDDPAGMYRATMTEMLDGWRRPGALDREITLPRGQRGRAEVAAWIHLAETLGHGWDLARAIGADPGFDDDAVAACLDECRQRMPPERGEGSPFADAVDGGGRPLIDQLAAYFGRDLGFTPA
jgi:uncharacterized protein (TIGR03086 family)